MVRSSPTRSRRYRCATDLRSPRRIAVGKLTRPRCERSLVDTTSNTRRTRVQCVPSPLIPFAPKSCVCGANGRGTARRLRGTAGDRRAGRPPHTRDARVPVGIRTGAHSNGRRLRWGCLGGRAQRRPRMRVSRSPRSITSQCSGASAPAHSPTSPSGSCSPFRGSTGRHITSLMRYQGQSNTLASADHANVIEIRLRWSRSCSRDLHRARTVALVVELIAAAIALSRGRRCVEASGSWSEWELS